MRPVLARTRFTERPPEQIRGAVSESWRDKRQRPPLENEGRLGRQSASRLAGLHLDGVRYSLLSAPPPQHQAAEGERETRKACADGGTGDGRHVVEAGHETSVGLALSFRMFRLMIEPAFPMKSRESVPCVVPNARMVSNKFPCDGS